ncbi:hypothetical protein [uncultured Kocuria sp.]|uniref:hypothetical protein n=1 Tax=uncultured Kocuria sp. TaxID=259305 RepID=UPI002595A72A|nr:hypothetical protein [uncultured Kocuria sp.]MCT1366435.1 hypothetical protein [Rothia sp. p3-SID1597]
MTSPNGEANPENIKRHESLVYRSRLMIVFSVAGFMGTVLSVTPVGQWSLVISMVLLALGVVWTILTMVSLTKTRGPWVGHVVLVLVLLANLYFIANSGINLALWNVTNDYRDCVQNSLTISSSGQCQSDLYDTLMSRILGR